MKIRSGKSVEEKGLTYDNAEESKGVKRGAIEARESDEMD